MAHLVPKEELFDKLSQIIQPQFVSRLKTYLLDETDDASRDQNAKNWLSWTSCQKNLKTVSGTVPSGILPEHIQGELTDVKVFSRGPDDKVYDQNASFRQRVARGNCVLELQNSKTTERSHDCVIFALKKFTGGLGDDDDRDIGDGFKFQKYFVRPIVEAERVICTKKMNGEAAHFAVRWIENDFYVIAGSKNVHLIFKNADDIQKYSEPRFLVARDVATSCFSFFQAMDVAERNALFSFFHHTKLTAVLEILLPHYQHIEDLSYLKAPKLFLISWSKTDLESGVYEQELCVPPDFCQEVGRAFHLAVTGYEVVNHKNLGEKLVGIRKGHGYEGEVLYFVDQNDEVIGLLKKKTIWYIIVRAVREKAKNAASKMRKDPSQKFQLDDATVRMKKRIKEIRHWLGMDPQSAAAWESLSVGFLGWLGKKLTNGEMESKELFGLYPVIWTRYLTETNRTDAIGIQEVTVVDDPDQPAPEAETPEAEHKRRRNRRQSTPEAVGTLAGAEGDGEIDSE